MNDTPNRYGVISRAFHWLMAVLILLQFMKFFDRISDGEHWIGRPSCRPTAPWASSCWCWWCCEYCGR